MYLTKTKQPNEIYGLVNKTLLSLYNVVIIYKQWLSMSHLANHWPHQGR